MSANLAPVVSSISPSSGPLGGGTPVNIGGGNFRPGCRVRIGGFDSPQVIFNSVSQITAITPP